MSRIPIDYRPNSKVKILLIHMDRLTVFYCGRLIDGCFVIFTKKRESSFVWNPSTNADSKNELAP